MVVVPCKHAQDMSPHASVAWILEDIGRRDFDADAVDDDGLDIAMHVTSVHCRVARDTYQVPLAHGAAAAAHDDTSSSSDSDE